MPQPVNVDPVLAASAVALIGFLIAIIGWFIRRDYDRMERGLKDEKEARDRELTNERNARAKDKHDLRGELASEIASRHALEVRIASEYVSRDHLTQALAPITEAVNGLRGTLKEIFNKLEGKADKGRPR